MGGELSIVNEVLFEKWVYGGDALARHEGVVVLAPYALPGERARVSAGPIRSGLLRASILDVLEPAAERTPPACPHFTRCGGCHYQHAAYEHQLRLKVEILREVLRRIGKFDGPERIEVIAGEPYHYRNRIQLHIGGRRLGFHAAGSHDVVSVQSCPVASPRLNQAIAGFRERLGHRRFPQFLRSLEIFTNEETVQLNVLDAGPRRIARPFFDWCAEFLPGAAEPFLDYSAAGFAFRVGHKSFFQVNRFLVDRLVEAVLENASGRRALDLYAGVGLFTLPLGPRFEQVTAVESVKGAVADLDCNARRAGVRIDIRCQRAEDFLHALPEPYDWCIADPPRSGLGRAVSQRLVGLRIPRLVLVSCDPSTLARDLSDLIGIYEIESIQLIDLFPQTSHIETITRLRLR